MERGDDAALVVAHVKDSDGIPLIGFANVCMKKSFSQFSEVGPFGSADDIVPLFQ
jgi:hypothetical protein